MFLNLYSQVFISPRSERVNAFEALLLMKLRDSARIDRTSLSQRREQAPDKSTLKRDSLHSS